MKFPKFIAFHTPTPVPYAALAEKLAEFRFAPMDDDQTYAIGIQMDYFDEPVSGNADIGLIRVIEERKNIPMGLLRGEVRKRLQAIEANGNPVLSTEEKDGIEDMVYKELIKRAFPKRTVTTILFDNRNSMIYFGMTSARKARDMYYQIRAMTGEILTPDIAAVKPVDSASYALRRWMMDKEDKIIPHAIHIGAKAEIYTLGEESCTIKVDNTPHSTDFIQEYLESGALVAKAQLQFFRDQDGEQQHVAQFTLHQDMSFTGLKISNLILPMTYPESPEDLTASLLILADVLANIMHCCVREGMQGFKHEQKPKDDTANTRIA